MPKTMFDLMEELDPKIVASMLVDKLTLFHYETEDWEFKYKKIPKWKKQQRERERKKYQEI